VCGVEAEVLDCCIGPFCWLLRPSSSSLRILPLVIAWLPRPGDRDRICGCDRARDDFVGEAYEARVGVEGLGRASISVPVASVAMDRVGESFRLFAGEGSIGADCLRSRCASLTMNVKGWIASGGRDRMPRGGSQ